MAVRRPKRKPGVQLGEDVARSMIIAGGARVFAAKGIRAASVEDLLEASNVSRRTFYRMFESKEDVALALYNFGTTRLVENWRFALASSTETFTQWARCIDVHLQNAATMGRLIFVLGGEATRQESPLHTRRMEVHDILVDLVRDANPELAKVDPLLVRATLFALEAVTRQVLTDGDEGRKVSAASIDRARKVMNRLVTAGFRGEAPGVTPLPVIE
jgi:AcrR family transcriptional regulator